MTVPPPAGPPDATRRAYEHTEHGIARPDPYSWFREVSSDEVLGHLAAERSWYDAATGHLTSQVGTLRSEMEARTPPTDTSVRWRHRSFSYYTRLPAGRDYQQLLRDLNSSSSGSALDPSTRAVPGDGFDSRTDVLLDANDLAGDSAYLELGLTKVSPDDRLLAYSVDLVGDEVYRLRFRDLDTGRDLDDEVPRSYYGGAWNAASDHFFYTVHDDAYRPFQVWRHRIGSEASEDALMLEEPDARFEVNVRATRSGGLVVAWSASRTTSEVWVLDAADPTAAFRSVGGRRPGVEYHAEHAVLADGSEAMLLVTNDEAQEFRLAHAPVPRARDQDHTTWQPLLPENSEERLERVDAFAGGFVVTLRTQGERRLRVLPTSVVEPATLRDARSARSSGTSSASRVETTSFDIRPAFEAGSVTLGPNADFEAPSITVRDQSYIHPRVWSEVDLRTGSRTVRHRHGAPGHDPADYRCEQREFPSADGTPVPATLVRHVDTPLDGSAPALLYGYGAYEATDDPEWDPALPSLLDRGVVFVHTHVRGGGEGGRRWWLDGRLDRKQNTFTDHLAVADGLARAGLVDGERIATRGLSAGGLLQGVVLSQRPERWRAVIAEAPFVDVVTSMLDPAIPLTVGEWDEWGDPRRRPDFDWLLAYSPYDNLPPTGSRPPLLVTGAVHDPRVMVWEPAKWVAALRHSDPDWSPKCLFRCETGEAAHAGPTGRFARLAYEAEIYAWLLDHLDEPQRG